MKGKHLFIFMAGGLIGEMTSTDVQSQCDTVEVAGMTAQAKHYIPGRLTWQASANRFIAHVTDITAHLGQEVDVAISDSNGDIGEPEHGLYYWGKAILQASNGEAIIHNLSKGSITLQGQGALRKNGATGWFITADNYHFITHDGKRFLARNQVY